MRSLQTTEQCLKDKSYHHFEPNTMPGRWNHIRNWAECSAGFLLANRWTQKSIQSHIFLKQISVGATILYWLSGPVMKPCSTTLWVWNKAIKHGMAQCCISNGQNKVIGQESYGNCLLECWLILCPVGKPTMLFTTFRHAINCNVHFEISKPSTDTPFFNTKHHLIQHVWNMGQMKSTGRSPS